MPRVAATSARSPRADDRVAPSDAQQIDGLIARFFSAFTTEHARRDGLALLRELFVSDAVIVKYAAQQAQRYTLDEFIAPRAELLRDGRLRDFSESELGQHTEIFANVAQRRSSYAKSGVLDGQAFQAQGVKLMQLMRMPDGWRLTSLLWEDEP
jgi:hypothetical protein